MSTAEGYVLPKPGIPKTLGLLNVIFGVLLVLLGLFGLLMMLVMPILFEQVAKTAKENQAKQEAQDKAEQKVFDDRVAAAKTDDEKKAIEQARAATPPKIRINPFDLSATTDALKDPTIRAVNIGGTITGLILHITLIVAGVGLIRLAPWGRSLSLWWAGLQIVQVIALLVAALVYVLPLTQEMNRKNIEKVEAQLKAQGGGAASQVGASVNQMTKIMESLAVPITVASSSLGLIYPIIILIMLNQAAARAACLRQKLDGIEEI